jgi:uncharacterized repeat protein (TIGR01451 family)
VDVLWNNTNLVYFAYGEDARIYVYDYNGIILTTIDTFGQITAIADNENVFLRIENETPDTVNLTITKTVNGSTTVLNGDFVTYIINVTNHGPINATNVTIIDILDARFTYGNHSASLGSYVPGSIWLIDSLGVNESAILTITVQIHAQNSITNTFIFIMLIK